METAETVALVAAAYVSLAALGEILRRSLQK
jgi:hypothetical protein